MAIAISPLPYPVPSTGWTVFTPSPDSRLIYCSTSGNDLNSGLTPARAVQTLAHAKTLLRPGFPDWLLLNRGDTWSGENFGDWRNGALLSGRSATEPMLISSYGTGNRPRINTGDTAVFDIQTNEPLSYLAIVGIHMNANTYNGSAGGSTAIRFACPTQKILVENCKIENWFRATTISQGTDIKFRRNVICDIRKSATLIYGCFISGSNSVLFEGNYFDNVQFSDPTLYSPALGCEESAPGVTAVDNVFTRCGSDAIALTGGGVAQRNFIYQAGCGLRFGMPLHRTPTIFNGIAFGCYDNIVLDAHSLATENEGIFLRNIIGGTVQNNIIARADSTGGFSIYYAGAGWKVRNVGCYLNKFYGFKGPVKLTGATMADLQNCLFELNEVQEPGNAPIFDAQNAACLQAFNSDQNTFYGSGAQSTWFKVGATTGDLAFYKTQVQNDSTSVASQVSYPAPTRSMANYAVYTGAGTTAQHVIDAFRAQERDTWNADLEAPSALQYFRFAFT